MSSVFEQAATIASWDDDYYNPIAEQYYEIAVPTMHKLMGVERGDRFWTPHVGRELTLSER